MSRYYRHHPDEPIRHDWHSNLAPGVSQRDLDGPEPTDEDGITQRQRDAEAAAEDKADAERDEP